MTEPPAGLRDLIPTLGDGWYELLAPIALTLYKPDVVRQQIHALTEQFINLLLEPTYSDDAAEALGVSLAEYHFVQSDVLGRTLELLTRQLFGHITRKQAPRLAAILGDLSTGYFKRSRDIILKEQEEIRAAHISAYRALQQTVNHSEKRYRTLVESANQAIFTLDRQGTLRFLNGSGARELGGRPRDFIGKTITMLFPHPRSEALMTGLSRILGSGEPALIEAEVPVRGHDEWFEASLKPLKNSAGEYESLLGIATNITERKLTESALQRSRERLATLHELDRGILAAQSPEEIAHAALAHVEELIPCWGAFVMLLDHIGGREFLLIAGNANQYVIERPEALGALSLVAKLREGEVLVLDDSREHLEPMFSWREVDSLDEQSSLLVPLLVREQLIGILVLIANPAVKYDSADIEVAQEIAAPLAIAIHNARLLEARRAAVEENKQLAHQVQEYAAGLEQLVDERTQELAALYDITAVTSEYLDRQTIMEKTLARALLALTRSTGTIQLVNANNQKLELVAHAGVSRDLAVHLNSLIVEAGLIDRVFESRKPLVMANEGEDTVLLPDDQPIPYGSIVCTPMRNQGQILGILSVFDTLEKQFSVDEVALLASIADHMGVAVENVRLRKQAERIAVGEEQKRLARELHDSVTQALYSLTLFAEAAQENGRAGRLDLVQAQLEEIGGTSQQALKEMRLLLYELRAGAPELEGLLVALRHRLDSVELRSGMSTHLSADTLVNVPTDMEQALLRIAVGALNNTLRHAEATAVNVSIRQLENTLRMEISDNGKGFDLAAAGRRGGMGLQIMRERAEAIKGQLKIETGPEAGTRIRIEVDTELVNHGH